MNNYKKLNGRRNNCFQVEFLEYLVVAFYLALYEFYDKIWNAFLALYPLQLFVKGNTVPKIFVINLIDEILRAC